MPAGDDKWFINVNKSIRSKLKIDVGSVLHVRLEPDESEYGLPVPEELSEALKQDPEGNELFHKLTPGKQRTLIYIVQSKKGSDLRISRSLIILEHLKINDGKINYRQLNEMIKEGSGKDTL
jgi:hypothetical protein